MADVINAPDSIQPATIDFNALHAKAMAFELPGETVTPEPVAAPVVETPAVVAEPKVDATPATTPNVLDLPDDAQIRVKVDGVEQIVSVAEYRNGIQREASYTKRMQTLAEQRREAESVLAARQADLIAKARAVQHMEEQFKQRIAQPQAPQAPQVEIDPNEIATVGEVSHALAALQNSFKTQSEQQAAQFMQTLQAAGEKLNEERAIQADSLKFTSAMNRTLENEDYKILREVLPFAEDSLRFQVAQLEPQSLDEAITMVEEIAKEWVGKLKATSADYLTRQEVAKARAKMEPSTGAPATVITTQPQKPASFMKKDGKLDWNALHAKALSMMDN